MERLSDSEFHARTDLPDWRVLLGRIEASFRAGSFAAAASLVQQIAAAAEKAGHHPDVDLRPPDRVEVTMSTDAVGGLTDRDVELATTISAVASSAGATSDPAAPARVEVAVDALDIGAVRPFWAAVLGYVEDPPGSDVLVDPRRVGPPLWFQQMDEPRPQRNRIHIDVTVPHDVAEARVEAAIAAGGHLVTDEHARSFWVLADPEGNEACVCTWQDRD